MGDPDPNPHLEQYTSTEALQELAKAIEESRKYFESICTGIGVQAEGELAYTYIFTLTRDNEPGFWDQVWSLGNCPMEFDHYITNDEYHNIWVPKDGDVMPYDWASGVQGPYRSKPVKNVRKILSADAQYVKDRLEGAKTNADGICNMQKEDFDAISGIATSMGYVNGLLDEIIKQLGTTDEDAQALWEAIQDNWEGTGSEVYATRIGEFKSCLVALGNASSDMKGANGQVALNIGELLVAIMELWKARIEAIDQQASALLGGAMDLVGLLAKPTVMGVLSKVIDIVGDVIVEMATKDVKDRIDSINAYADMFKRLQPIEQARERADMISWPTMNSWSPKRI